VQARQRSIEDVLRSLLDPESVMARLDGSPHTVLPVGIPPIEGEALQGWVVRSGAASTIEIGLGYGISALYICAGLLKNNHPGAHHVALDPNQTRRFSDIGLQAIEEAGLSEMFELLPEDSQLALPRLVAEGRSFDFAFVDGNHRFDGVFVDLMYLARLVRGGGIVFLDDYELPGVKKAVGFCTTNLEWALEEQGRANGLHHWVVLRLPAVPVERAYHYFVDF
jgi:predicted O-methyltransferase YrrM